MLQVPGVVVSHQNLIEFGFSHCENLLTYKYKYTKVIKHYHFDFFRDLRIVNLILFRIPKYKDLQLHYLRILYAAYMMLKKAILG